MHPEIRRELKERTRADGIMTYYLLTTILLDTTIHLTLASGLLFIHGVISLVISVVAVVASACAVIIGVCIARTVGRR
jgi:hypothetical protein